MQREYVVGIDPLALATIAGMAAVTYTTRIAGLMLMSRIVLSARAEAWLAGIPGAVLMAIVAPAVFNGRAPEALAGLLTALVAIRTRNMLLSAAVGVVAVWVLRQAL